VEWLQYNQARMTKTSQTDIKSQWTMKKYIATICFTFLVAEVQQQKSHLHDEHL
jgi:hypothetical protein